MFYSLLIVQLITFFYHQITTRFDLFPFNGVRHYSLKERRLEALVNGLIMLVAILFSGTKIPILVAVSGFIWTLVVVGAVLNWWLPYITGREFYKMSGDEAWKDVHGRIFSETIHILPIIRNHPRPNLEHVILHMLILASCILAWLSVARA